MVKFNQNWNKCHVQLELDSNWGWDFFWFSWNTKVTTNVTGVGGMVVLLHLGLEQLFWSSSSTTGVLTGGSIVITDESVIGTTDTDESELVGVVQLILQIIQ